MVTKTESFHNAGFLVSEARDKTLSRDAVTLISGQNLLAGTVLGQITTGSSAVAAALGTNTGNGTFGAITVAAPALPGAYTVEFDAATLYVVSDPNGREIGHGATGSAFSAGGIGFTITAGGTAFVAGDSFTVTVAAGSLKWAVFDPTAANGTQNAAAILYQDTDASAGDTLATIISRLAEINKSELVWGAGVTTTPQKTAALAQLQALNIVGR